MIKCIFFDVANTLLYKPGLYNSIRNLLFESGIKIGITEIEHKHKILSEILDFPDQPDENFYSKFNSLLLLSLGIEPNDDLQDKIYTRCSNLAWAPFDDTEILSKIELPKGIIANWDLSLKSRLKENFSTPFKWIIGSMEIGYRKPDRRIYQQISTLTGFDPQDILYIGDSIKLDIQPAKDLGIRAILIDRINIYPGTNIERIGSLKNLKSVLKFT